MPAKPPRVPRQATTTGRVAASVHYVVHRAEEGGYWAEVPALPGCFTEADTLAALRRNVREAIQLYLDDAATPTRARKRSP